MNILLICNYWHFEFEKKSSRYRTMADILSEDDEFELEVISSSFRHQTKEQRDLDYIRTIKTKYNMTLLYEPDYKRNISIKRIFSHHHLAKEIGKYLNSCKKPDVIICSVPSLSVGSVVTRFANKHNIKVIIDIQDLWPEAFKMALNIPIISNILFFPMMLQANRIYQRADRIMAVSETYVKRGLSKNKKRNKGFPLYIGTDSNLVEESIAGIDIKKDENEFWIGYIGALGYSYDIRLVIDAIHLLNQQGYSNIVFKIMGQGVLLEEFKQYAKDKRVNCDFMGFLEYGEMMGTLMKCELAVNPIVGDSVASIINKVSDYAMAAVPVINTQNSEEYRGLLEKYNCGLNCINGDSGSVAQAIKKLYDNKELRIEMGVNAKKLGKECFDRQKTYPAVKDLIYELGGETV